MRTAEFEILSSAITNRERLDSLLEYSPMDIFNDPEAIIVFNTLRELNADGMGIDFQTLNVRLTSQYAERATNIITELGSSYPTVHFYDLLSELVRHKRTIRIQEDAEKFVESIKNGAKVDEITDLLMLLCDKMSEPTTSSSITLRDLAAINIEDVFQRHCAIPTGIDSIDNFIPGIYPGQLVIIAARPGLGKTSLALQIASNMPKTSLFFSLEMNNLELYARRLSGLSSVESWKIETSQINQDEALKIFNAQENIRNASNNLIIMDRHSDINMIINMARKFIRRGNISAIFIDYLTLISGGRGENQNLRVADITRRLKTLAVEYNIPVILLSQLNRSVEHQNRYPLLSDLRDSGAIEQDADIVIFIHEDDGDTLFVIAKNRKGRTGEINVQFEKEFTRFREIKQIGNSNPGELLLN